MKKIAVIGLLLMVGFSSAQGVYEFSLVNTSPQSALFFLEPGSQDPSRAKGIFGLFSNPASMGFLHHYEGALAFGIGSKSKFSFQYTAVESTEDQGAIRLPIDFYYKEKGGLNFVGAGYSFGPLGVGIGVVQGDYAGLDLNIKGKTALDLDYQIEDTIYYDYDQDTAVIPVTWNLTVRCSLDVTGTGKGGISSTPIMLGVGMGFGSFGVGIGLKHYKFSGDLNSHMSGVTRTRAIIMGIPHSGWQGSISADAGLRDTLLMNEFGADLSGGRTAFLVGALLDLRVVKIGLSFEKGFSSRIKDINVGYTVINISGEPEYAGIDSIVLNEDSLRAGRAVGNAYVSYSDFKKDTTINEISGQLKIPGYSEVRLGLGFPFFNFYGGAILPSGNKEIGAFYLGTMTSFPLQMVTLRFGTHNRFDYAKDGAGKLIPYRFSSNLGIGATLKTSLGFLGKNFGFPAEFSLGIRTSLLPLLSGIISSEIEDEDIENFKRANLLSGTGFNLGIRVYM
ncbi:MAG: hypothetical protein DRQ04_05735 [Candidatus Hydrothermota bacterium]|nr:MAG: hypothetical protein DRQ04_05735 [Candidatus Hydrothermae bacterium]